MDNSVALLSNSDLQKWFSREHIPIEELTQMWLQLDRNETTRAEISALREENDTVELEKRLRKRIEFGTAGTFRLLRTG